MEVLAIIAILTFLGIIIYSIPTINAYSLSRYDYKPFQIGNLAIIAVPCFISIVIFWSLEPNNGGYVDYKDLNHLVLYLLVLGSCMIVGISIYNHTKNILISVYSAFLIFVGSILIVFMVILFILEISSRSQNRKR